MAIKHTYIFLVFIFAGLCIRAQIIPFISEKSLGPEKKYSVQYWTTENGLPQNSINAIEQTPDGYLWLATYDGLVQFDGVKFTTFNSSNTPQLKTSGIRRLFTDETGRLWLITSEGALLSYFKREFTTYSLPYKIDYIKNTLTSFNKEIILVCGESKLWILKDKVFEPFQVPPIKKIYCIQTVNKNTLYVGADKGLWKYDGQWMNIPAFKEIGLSQLYVSPKNELIADAEFNLYRVNGIDSRLIEIPFSLKDINEYKLAFNELGELVVLTGMGLWAIADKKVVTTTMDDGLSSDVINSFFIDKEKNIWAGTNNGGLNRLKPKLFKAYSKEDGMSEDGATAILESKSGSVYIGNNCKGTSEFKEGRFVNTLKQIKNDVCTWSLMEDPLGQLWVGTYGGGVSIYRPGGKIENYKVPDGLSDNVIFAMFTDSKGISWVGTNLGLTRYANNKFSVFDTTFKNKTTHISEDKNGTLWLCTDKGLAKIQNKRVLFPGGEMGLKEGAVRYLYEDAEGTLWIGTSGKGLVRIKNGNAFYFSNFTGQLDKNVWSIAEDKNGNLWMPSNTGMFVVNRKQLNDFADKQIKNLHVIYVGKEDGLKSIEFNGGFQPSVIKTKEGKFWFPTVKGAVLADPEMLSKIKNRPRVVIERMYLDDSLISISDTLVVSGLARNITVSFSAPFFSNPARLNFQYKIEGLDNDWNNLGSSREIKLNNIPEGMHRLRVRAADSDPGEEAGLVIYKPVPLWKQTRFILLTAAFFVLLLVLAAIVIISGVRRREKRKTYLNKQYASIELRALQSQLNPHFIFNCLNSIQHFIVANDEVSANKYLVKFSKLMRMFLEHSQSSVVSLQQETELLQLYVEIESLRFKNGFDFKLEVADNLDAYNIQIPSMLFQPYVENAIKHGLLNLERKGTLAITFGGLQGELIGIIEDDGVGRARAKELQSEVQRNHTSRGMDITNERIAAINYIENTSIQVEIIDKTIEANGSTGTKIIIKIPI